MVAVDHRVTSAAPDEPEVDRVGGRDATWLDIDHATKAEPQGKPLWPP
jgi:hypothetical protein